MTFRYSPDYGTAGGLRKHLKSQKKNVSTTNPNRMKFLVGSMLQPIIAKSFRIRYTCWKSMKRISGTRAEGKSWKVQNLSGSMNMVAGHSTTSITTLRANCYMIVIFIA